MSLPFQITVYYDKQYSRQQAWEQTIISTALAAYQPHINGEHPTKRATQKNYLSG